MGTIRQQINPRRLVRPRLGSITAVAISNAEQSFKIDRFTALAMGHRFDVDGEAITSHGRHSLVSQCKPSVLVSIIQADSALTRRLFSMAMGIKGPNSRPLVTVNEAVAYVGIVVTRRMVLAALA